MGYTGRPQSTTRQLYVPVRGLECYFVLRSAGRMDQRIAVTLSAISRDIRTAPAPQEIARALGLSISQFYTLFRRETGTPPATYIRTRRYEKARELLSSSRFSIKEITYLVGINDVSHFVRDFEKMYGASPTRFRQGCAYVPPTAATSFFTKTVNSANKS